MLPILGGLDYVPLQTLASFLNVAKFFAGLGTENSPIKDAEEIGTSERFGDVWSGVAVQLLPRSNDR